MQNCCELNNTSLQKQINEYDEQIKELYKKRMEAADKLIASENHNNNLNSQNSFKNINFLKEYSFFANNINFIEQIHRNNIKPVKNYNIKFKNAIDVKTVCYQGLPFSYSESVAKALFEGKKLINVESFENVFKNIFENSADVGIIPIENSTAGYVNDVYDLLLKYDLYINYSYIKKVDHCIAGTKDSVLENIKEVYSHPQALMQCADYIKKHGMKTNNEINTAVAAKRISEKNNKTIGCICSPEAADFYGLKIHEQQINHEHNYTRFGAITKHLICDKSHNKVSIVFSVPHKIGTLNEVLSYFSYYNINLSYIYSRPLVNKPWEYLFYLDFEGNLLNDDVLSLLNQLNIELPFLKILGSFQV